MERARRERLATSPQAPRAGSCFGATTSSEGRRSTGKKTPGGAGAQYRYRGAVLVSPTVSFFAVPRAHHTVSQGGSAPLGQHKYMYLVCSSGPNFESVGLCGKEVAR
jgi:hypothetical protein